MNWKALLLGASGGAAMAAGCSNPPPSESEPARSPLAQQAPAWRAPIIATTSNREVLSRLASPSGSFRIVDGCLAFIDIAGVKYSPVFGRGRGSPVAGPDGLVWGGRRIGYGEKVKMGGGSAPRDLEINEEARRNCRGPFLVIAGFPPRDAKELEFMLAQRKARPTARPKGE